MPRGVKKQVTYTGKAAKINEKIIKLEEELKGLKLELKAAYKEQLKEERLSAKKKEEENKQKIMKIIQESGKTPEEILAILANKE